VVDELAADPGAVCVGPQSEDGEENELFEVAEPRFAGHGGLLSRCGYFDKIK
jgi:hypothetical protein